MLKVRLFFRFFFEGTMFHFFRNKTKDNFYLLKNSEMLLEHSIISSFSDSNSINPIRIFSETELKEATNNYHPDRLLYKHEYLLRWKLDQSDRAYYYFYKGIHQDRTILVSKLVPDLIGFSELEDVIFEIVALSQINHKNMVKLLGCCLETYFPTQVYEFCCNTTLHDQIHKETHNGTPQDFSCIPDLISWENRLRIASEIADAVSYLHTANSRPIVHRNICSRNVLLDHNFVAKLFDLSNSVSIPLGKTHRKVDRAMGTNGYLAPEQFYHRVSEKTDVYSFGVLLLELLTGYRPYIGDELLQIMEYKTLKSNKLNDCFKIWELEGSNGMVTLKQQLQDFLVLAVRCIHELEEERPTMVEVAKVLSRIKRMQGSGNHASTSATP